MICEGQVLVQDWGAIGKALARMMGVRGMTSINPFSAFKGVSFVDSVERVEWLQARGRLVSRGVVVRLQKWLPRENIVVLGKFRRGCIELRGLPFHLWNENQLRFILKNLEKVTKVDQLRKWLPRENIVVLGKFRRGCIELRSLPFHLWNENQL